MMAPTASGAGVVAVILTSNEERHIERCIRSVEGLASHVVVVDSGSTDATVEIAERLGATVLRNPWVNYAVQFNWALSQLPDDAKWVLRIDADEYLTPELRGQLVAAIATAADDIDGIFVNRRMTFQGRLIRHGGVFPISVLRAFRRGRGECENRWMDEHVKVAGRTIALTGELIDDNLQSLTWWTQKHNVYASREAVDLLNLEYHFMPHDTVADVAGGGQASRKRWIKEKIYARLPGGFRAFAYFLYRYVVRLGFLDGQAGTAFHFLQGLWYRYLVDAKVNEVKRYIRRHGVEPQVAIERILGIKLG